MAGNAASLSGLRGAADGADGGADVTRTDIESELVDILVEMFELEPSEVTLDARLYEDLDIDSIDAVDLIVRLKTFTEANVDPERAKGVRTVRDVVDLLDDLLHNSHGAGTGELA